MHFIILLRGHEKSPSTKTPKREKTPFTCNSSTYSFAVTTQCTVYTHTQFGKRIGTHPISIYETVVNTIQMATEFELELGPESSINAADFVSAITQTRNLVVAAQESGHDAGMAGDQHIQDSGADAYTSGNAYGRGGSRSFVSGNDQSGGSSNSGVGPANRLQQWLEKKNRKLEAARKAAEEARMNDPDLCFSPRLISVRRECVRKVVVGRNSFGG
jgi:hypothetical protein